MRDVDLYSAILGVQSPWRVTEVDLRQEQGEVEVFVEHGSKEALRCPECDEEAKRHDTRRRSWQHLPTCQFKTILTADVPRVRCETHGTKTIGVPWSDPGSGFTALFEALVIDWLGEASIAGVARRLDLTWDQVDGVLQRAVRRGLARRELAPARRLGVDETSFQKRHEYVTLVGDLDRGVVHHVADGRGKDALRAYFEGLSERARARIESVAMDMWAPYIVATFDSLDLAEAKICFDKFHVAMHLGGAVDRVRREENRALREQGDNALVGTKYVWLHHPDRMPERHYPRFGALMKRALKTSRAWLLKELGMDALNAPDREAAKELFERWYFVGDPLTPRADEARRSHGEASSRRHPQRHRARRHQCPPRGHQHRRAVAQALRQRLPQPRALPQRHLLSSRWARSLPSLFPHEFLKSRLKSGAMGYLRSW